jgi:hypothetical protein
LSTPHSGRTQTDRRVIANIQRLFTSWNADTGLVASPPIGSRPHGFWAEIECAFLNTYQARWQYIVDSFGRGFAQGKTMLWRRADLERAGGIEALGREVAEDAAATKIVRGAGLNVRLVDRPLAQPLGRRSAHEVWNRQLRWARLRRASFFMCFLPEILSGGVLPIICAAIVAHAPGWPVLLFTAAFALIWYGSEMALAAASGWHLAALHPLYGLIRYLILPALFVAALRGNDFVWRGNAMQVERIRPIQMAPPLRPRLEEIAATSRKRLRALPHTSVLKRPLNPACPFPARRDRRWLGSSRYRRGSQPRSTPVRPRASPLPKPVLQQNREP